MFSVYVKTNDQGQILAINSSEFIQDPTGWIKIGMGAGDRFHHPQQNYFDKTICDVFGRFNYMLVNGVPIEIAESEKPSIQIPQPTESERLKAVEDALLMMM